MKVQANAEIYFDCWDIARANFAAFPKKLIREQKEFYGRFRSQCRTRNSYPPDRSRASH